MTFNTAGMFAIDIRRPEFADVIGALALRNAQAEGPLSIRSREVIEWLRGEPQNEASLLDLVVRSAVVPSRNAPLSDTTYMAPDRVRHVITDPGWIGRELAFWTEDGSSVQELVESVQVSAQEATARMLPNTLDEAQRREWARGLAASLR